LFEKGGEVYRIKGVDPFAHFTARVAESPQNRIQNVRDAHTIAKTQRSKVSHSGNLRYTHGKPFGLLSLAQAGAEIDALQKLANIYPEFEIENPCEALFYKGTEVLQEGEELYQTVLRLNSRESDFRVQEFDALLTERLDMCLPHQIAAKCKNICRLYGRFNYWAGFNAGLLAVAGLLPKRESFHPQNWVIDKYKSGYGIFRVDHTSTISATPQTTLASLTEDLDGVPYIINEFSVFASCIQIAANPQVIKHTRGELKFSEILHSPEKTGVSFDETALLSAHRLSFNVGLSAALQVTPLVPIPEEMFQEALA
jgi:hypothetical protein